MTNKIRRIKGIALLLATLATGCASVDGVLMSRKVERGVGSSAYALGISEEQVVREANTDYDPFLTPEEHNDYRLKNIRRLKAKNLPSIPELAKMIGLPTEPPYDPDRENR